MIETLYLFDVIGFRSLYWLIPTHSFGRRAIKFYTKPCFFFNAAMFQQYRELDAVVVHDDPTLTLCLNPLSPRYSRFRTTDLAEAFGNHFNVVDPPEMEVEGTCFLADSPPEPRTPDDVVRYLKAKYNLDTVETWRFPLFNEPVE